MSDINDIILLCISEGLSTRVEAYHALKEKVTSQNSSANWGDNITSDTAKKIIVNLKKDLYNANTEVSLGAAGFLGYYLDNDKLMDLLSDSEEHELINDLITLIETTKEKKLLTTVLWCLSQSKFCCDIYIKNLTRILKVTNDIITAENAAVTTNEALVVIKSLMECIPDQMRANISLWFASVFVNLFHDLSKIRNCAYACFHIYRGPNPTVSIMQKLSQLIAPFIPQIKSHYCKTMSNLIQEDYVMTFKIWRLVVMMLGKNLHTGTALINGLLEVVEKGFKHSLNDYRIEAFKCWQVLISNFSIDSNCINHHKRVKLLVAPFKSNNAKTEEVALAKINAWWFLVSSLAEKNPDNFELVVVPLLKFCFSNCSSGSRNSKERVSICVSSPGKRFSHLFLKSLEVLALLLSHRKLHDDSLFFSMSCLNNELVTPFVFNKNHQIFFNATLDALTNIDRNNTKQYELGQYIMKAVLLNIHSFLEANPNKNESIDMVKEFFRIITEFESRSIAGDSFSLFLFEFLELQIGQEFGFANNIMNSRHYNILSGSKAQNIMNGTLSNYFIYKLGQPIILYFASKIGMEQRFFNVWSTIIANSKPATGRLFFYQSIIEELNEIAQLPDCKSSILFQLWNLTCDQLISFIRENNLIDQGNGNETDWSCIYKTLLFPVLGARDHLEDLDDIIYQKIVSNWSTLWQNFISLTPLSVPYDPGCEVEYIAKHLFTLVTKEIAAPPDAIPIFFTFMSDILFCLIDKFRFSELGKKPPRFVQSPSKVRRKVHTLHNLGTSVELLNNLVLKAMRMVSTKRQNMVGKLFLAGKRCLENVTSEKMSWTLISSLLESLQVTLKVNPSAKFNSDAEKNVLGLWKAFCNYLEWHIASKVTQEQLNRLSPLFVIALQSSHKEIKRQMESLWISKFSSTKHPLPNSLMETLKGACLPPASLSDTPLESSQRISANKVKSPFFEIKPSPSTNSRKLNLGKDSCFKSPLRPTPTQEKSISIKQSIEEMEDDEFVKVNTPKSKCVLTQHQKEKLKERAEDIPAMYNDLSQSASQFINDDSFSRSISQEPLNSSQNLSFIGKIPNSSTPSTSPSKSMRDTISSTFQTDFSMEEKSVGNVEAHCNNLEMSSEHERSLSDSVILQKEEAGNAFKDSGKENRRSLLEHKRKSATPLKKSFEDVRKALKGPTNSKKGNKNHKIPPKDINRLGVDLCPNSKTNHEKMDVQTNRKVLSPIKAGSTTTLSNNKSLISTGTMLQTQSDSEEEIPNTQPDLFPLTPTVLGLSKFSPHTGVSQSLSRQRRMKRKNYFDIDGLTNTATKKSKLSSSTSNNNSKLSIESTVNCETVILESDDSVIIEDQIESPLISKEPSSPASTKESSSKTDLICDAVAVLTPTKVSRSGRKIIPPKKDMPEPMTPPLNRKKSPSQGSDDSRISPKASSVSPSKSKQSPMKDPKTKSASPNKLVKNVSPKKQIPSPSDHSKIKKSFEQLSLNYAHRNSLGKNSGCSMINSSSRKFEVNDLSELNILCLEKSSPVLSSSNTLVPDSSINQIASKNESKDSSNGDKKSDGQNTVKALRKEPPLLRSKKRLSPKLLRSTKNKNRINKRGLPDKKVKKVLKMCKNVLEKKKPLSSKKLTSDSLVIGKIKNVSQNSTNHEVNETMHSEEPIIKDQHQDECLKEDKSLQPPSKINIKVSENSNIFKVCSNVETVNNSTTSAKLRVSSNDMQDDNQTSNSKDQKNETFANSLTSEILSLKHFEKKIGSPIHILKSPNNKLTLIKIQIPPSKNPLSPICNKVDKIASPTAKTSLPTILGPICEQKLNSSIKKTEKSPSDQISEQSSSQQVIILKNSANLAKEKSIDTNLTVKERTREFSNTPQSKDEVTQATSKISKTQESDESKVSHKKSEVQKYSHSDKRLSTPKTQLATSSGSSPLTTSVILSPVSAKKVPRNELSKRLFGRQEFLQKSLKSNESVEPPNIENNTGSSASDLGLKSSPKTSIFCKKTDSKIVTIGVKSLFEKRDNLKSDDIRGAIETEQLTEICSENMLQDIPKINDTNLEAKETKSKVTNVDPVKIGGKEDSSPVKSSPKNLIKNEIIYDSNESGDKSPGKSPSKLTSTLGTPERKRLSLMKVQVPGSRAAIMLACAKAAMKTRVGTENGDALISSDLKASLPLPFKGVSNMESPNRKRKHIDLIADERPWAKHRPSPDASPANSILKKPPGEEEIMAVIDEISDSVESPLTSASKSRRVSFADPPVSESVEIPRSAKAKRKRAQKRLDMTEAEGEGKVKEAAPLTNEFNLQPLDCFLPIYDSLAECQDPIDKIASELTSPTLVERLVTLFKERGCHTIGTLSKMTEAELHSYPVCSPKTSKTLQCLQRYSKIIQSSTEKHKKGDIALISNTSCNDSPEKACEALVLDFGLDSDREVFSSSATTNSTPSTAISFEVNTLDKILKRDASVGTIAAVQKDSSMNTISPVQKDASDNTLLDIQKLVSEEIEQDPESISRFVDKLTTQVKYNLFNKLAGVLSYDDVIEVFYNFLKNKPRTS